MLPYSGFQEFRHIEIGIAQQYKSPRENGCQQFVIDDELIREFADMEIHQFDIPHPHQENVWGLFGEKDTLAHFEPLFLKHYIKAYHFPGGHTPTAEEITNWYIPLVEKLLIGG